jgi:hypothetical protein
MAEKNLWPTDFTPVTESMPADLLEAQATALGNATDGKLAGRVEVGSLGDKISLNFVIVAPSLNGYQYRLLQVLHGVYPPYPLQIVLKMDERREAKNRNQFETQLAQILQAPSTRNVIAELLTLVDKAESRTKGKKKPGATTPVEDLYNRMHPPGTKGKKKAGA